MHILGSSGNGLYCQTSAGGPAVSLNAASGQHGLSIVASGVGHVINLYTAGTGHGIYANIAGGGNGIYARATGGNGHGILASGDGSGHGMSLVKGTTGKDIDADEIDALATAANLATVDTVVDAIKLKTDGLNFSGTDVLATLDGEEVAASAATIADIVTAIFAKTNDGVALSDMCELVAAMVNGRYKINTPSDGDVTFYKRNSSTTLFVVHLTTTERTRV
jgi:hypothetical protein